MKNLGVMGPMGSGKGSAAKYISKKYGYKIISMGNIVRALAKREGVKLNRLNLEKVQKRDRKKYGDNYIIRQAIDKARAYSKPVIFDGMRSAIDVKTAKKEMGVKMILIDARPEVRFQRLKKRRRADFPRTFEEFKKVEASENKTFHMHKTFSYADYRIDNSKDKANSRTKLDSLIKRINKTK